MNDLQRQQILDWDIEWSKHLGVTPLPHRSTSNKHACDGELWGQPCGRKKETEDWVAYLNCPAYRLWEEDKSSNSDPVMWWSTFPYPKSLRHPERDCPPGVDPHWWVDGHPLSVGLDAHPSLNPPAIDHERWWRHNDTGVLLYTSEPYTPVDQWDETPDQYAQRVFDCLGLYVAYGRQGYGHYAAQSLITNSRPVNSMMIAISMNRDLAHAAAACECIPSSVKKS